MELPNVRTDAPTLPSRVCLYAGEGEGKTSLACQFPNPIVLMGRGETGLLDLKNSGQVSPDIAFYGSPTGSPDLQTWGEFRAALKELGKCDHEYKTLVIDTWDAMERMLVEHLIADEFKGDAGEGGFAGYGKGYERVSQITNETVSDDLEAIWYDKKMTVIICAHSTISTFRNPEGTDYDHYTPCINKKSWPILKGWTGEVWFMHTPVQAAKSEKADKGSIGQSSGTRYLYTLKTPAFDAKSRKGLPARIKLGDSAEESFAAIMETTKPKKETEPNESE